jgi:hypothetical protein
LHPPQPWAAAAPVFHPICWNNLRLFSSSRMGTVPFWKLRSNSCIFNVSVRRLRP